MTKLSEPENLAGTWRVCDIRQLNPEAGTWKITPADHFAGFTVTLSERWKNRLPLQGEFYEADFISSDTVVLHNPSDTVRVKMERVLTVKCG